MTGYQWQQVQWQEVLIAFAGALVLTLLVLIAVTSLILTAIIATGRDRAKTAQMDAAYRRFSSGDALPLRNRRRWLKPVLLVLVILNLVSLGVLVSRPGELAAESTSTQSATPGALSSATPAPVRRRRRPYSWRTQPTPPGPSKPFESKVATGVEQRPSAGAALAGRPVAGIPVTYED